MSSHNGFLQKQTRTKGVNKVITLDLLPLIPLVPRLLVYNIRRAPFNKLCLAHLVCIHYGSILHLDVKSGTIFKLCMPAELIFAAFLYYRASDFPVSYGVFLVHVTPLTEWECGLHGKLWLWWKITLIFKIKQYLLEMKRGTCIPIYVGVRSNVVTSIYGKFKHLSPYWSFHQCNLMVCCVVHCVLGTSHNNTGQRDALDGLAPDRRQVISNRHADPIHWNGNVFILMKFSSVAAMEVVKMTTSNAASDENFVKMTTLLFGFSVVTTADLLLIEYIPLSKHGSVWWLRMAWRQIGTRPSATIILTRLQPGYHWLWYWPIFYWIHSDISHKEFNWWLRGAGVL